VVYEIQLKKLEVAKSLKRYIGAISFVEVLEATTILACFENFLKSRLSVIAKSAVTLYILC